jgi:hypothetical protein
VGEEACIVLLKTGLDEISVSHTMANSSLEMDDENNA